jgi:PAS domain S-box-containing protein
LEVLRWLHSSGITTPFILITGTLADEQAVECIKEGAHDYILKDKLERLPYVLMHALQEHKLRKDRDVSERELRESQQQFLSIIQGAPYGIYRADTNGRILMTNPALVRMLGYEAESDVLKLNLKADVYVNAKEWRAMEDLEQPGALRGSEVSWRRKDGGTMVVRIAGRRLEADVLGLPVYEVFVQDITEQRILEQQFQQAQKMEAIGRLAGGVAHDFNNLLMIIRGCAELLDHHKAEPAKIAGYIKQINDATSIAASVVQQLMAFSRKQVPERNDIDFNTVLRDLRRMLPRLLGEDIQIVFSPGQTLDRVSADRAQIEQIILNLAVNARDAMPVGGKLLLETSNVFLNTPQIERRGVELPPGRYVMLSVSDSGTGMDEETQSHIFEPFFTTKEHGKGTGLGLATVYGIVKESRGSIIVDSELGKGTMFRIYFPSVTAAKEAAAVAAIVPAASGGSETILLVEDEQALREITCEYLQSRGYKVLTAGSGLHALEICRAYDSPIDILLTDIIMPGIPGPELVKSAMNMRPEMRVIYVSGYIDRGLENAVLEQDAVFLHKPYSLADLGNKIRSAATAARAVV